MLGSLNYLGTDKTKVYLFNITSFILATAVNEKHPTAAAYFN